MSSQSCRVYQFQIAPTLSGCCCFKSNLSMKYLYLLVFFLITSVIFGRYKRPPAPNERPPLLMLNIVQASLDSIPEPVQEEVFFVDESLDQVLQLLRELTGRKIMALEGSLNPIFNFDSQDKFQGMRQLWRLNLHSMNWTSRLSKE